MSGNLKKIEKIHDELSISNLKKAKKMLSSKLFGLIPVVDVNSTDANGNSFLVSVLWKHNNNSVDEISGFIDFLLSRGFNLNIQNKYGVTPLYRYFLEDNITVDLVELLLKKGADPNLSTTEYKFTPLIRAAQSGLIKSAKVLVEYNADIHHKDIWGFSAIDYAKTYGTEEMVDFLASKGAKINEEAKVPLEECDWHTGAETWEELAELFIKREVTTGNPNLKSLHRQLKRFPAEQQHGVWIHVGQSLYDRFGNHPLTICSYVEALNADPDPSSVAWKWLDGTYDQSMRVFSTYNGAKPLRSQLQSAVKDWGIRSIKD